MIDSKVRTYNYALRIINFVGTFSPDLGSQVIAKQLLRSATSIGANIIEAQASPSRKDFANFFNHALKSAHETKYWLCLLRDSHKADMEVTNTLIQEVEELAKILGSSILTLRGKKKF